MMIWKIITGKNAIYNIASTPEIVKEKNRFSTNYRTWVSQDIILGYESKWQEL